MAAGNLSPRQKMINMMYLVLTALLALNVSKEVLNSFFEVNKGIERTTNNFNAKNASTYSAFKNAASNNPEKYQEVSDKAFLIKSKADATTLFIQEMKYDLVYKVDKQKIYLGNESDIYNADGDLIETLAVIEKKFNELTQNQQSMPIAYLKNKSNRYASQDLFFPKNLEIGNKKRATELKEKIEEYRDFLIELVGDNQALINNINIVFDVSEVYGKNKESWEKYNFVDMPSVGALTILSKIQSDLRNVEADVIDYLKRDIDAKSLKFGDAEGVSIPVTNFVLMNDSFRATIFTAAKQDGQEPEIWVGDFDSLGGGQYKMVGDYETVKVINGKGFYSKRTTSVGVKKYEGLISMKTETGTKMYPFNGEYRVASKQAVASPTNMNVLFIKAPNPINVAVAGYSASQVSASIKKGYGTVRPVNKSKGEWIVEPTRLTPSDGVKDLISLYVTDNGKRRFIKNVKFKVKNVPEPFPKAGKLQKTVVSRSELVQAQMLQAELKDFYFDKKVLRYKVISFTMTSTNNTGQFPITNKGAYFTDESKKAIKNALAGTQVTFTDIKVQRTGMKPEILDLPCIYTIK